LALADGPRTWDQVKGKKKTRLEEGTGSYEKRGGTEEGNQLN